MGKHSLLKTAIVGAAALGLANTMINRTAEQKHKTSNLMGQEFHSNHGNLYYTVQGEGSPILLLHDLNPISSNYEFTPLAKKLAESHKVYNLDLLGCGQSDRPAITYTNFIYVQMIMEFCKEVIGQPVIVIASHDSATIPLMTSRMEATLFTKIILINPAKITEDIEETTNVDLAYKNVLFTPLLGTALYNRAISEAEMKKILATYFSKTEISGKYLDLYYEVAHKNISKGKYLYACKMNHYLDCDVSPAVKAAKNLILILGEEYENENAIIDDYKEKNKKIKTAIIPQTGLLPQLEASQETFEILSQYLS